MDAEAERVEAGHGSDDEQRRAHEQRGGDDAVDGADRGLCVMCGRLTVATMRWVERGVKGAAAGGTKK